MIANKFGSGMETDTYFVAITATVIIMTTLGAALKHYFNTYILRDWWRSMAEEVN